MFASIFRFELKYRFIRPATYIYFGLCFIFVFLVFTIGGVGGSEKVMFNSPKVISEILGLLSIYGLLLGSAVMGMPVYRDHEHRTANYLFATPIREKPYLSGRFLGSFVTLVFIFVGVIVGIFLGSEVALLFKLKNYLRVGEFHLSYVLYPFLIILLPNLFFSGALFFSLVALTRKVSVTYVVSILLFIAYLLGNYLIQDVENKNLVDLLDPFAVNTLSNAVKYFSIEEQNHVFIPLQDNLLINRIIWMGVSLLLLGVTFYRFSFQQFLSKMSGKNKKEEPVSLGEKVSIVLPKVDIRLNTKVHFQQMINLSKLEFTNIIRDPFFLAILMGGLLFLFLDQFLMYGPRNSENLPLTLYMLDAENFDFFLFAFALITFYTGEVVHRDRSVGFNHIADTMPVPNWLVYGSKLMSMLYIVLCLSVLPMILGIFNQAIKGYFHFEIGLYLEHTFFIILPSYLQYLALAFFVHILVNNKFAGHGITLGVWFIIFCFRSFFEFDYNLLLYGYEPDWRYSDLNGFGHFVQPLLWFNIYWLALGVVMLLLGNLLWNRGVGENLKTRVRVGLSRINKLNGAALAVFSLIWLGAGVYIFYNVSILNDYRTADEQKALQAEYERKYKQYEVLAQPKITSLALEVHIFPEDRRVDYSGKFWLKNKTDKTIDSLHLEWVEKSEILSMKLAGEEVQPAMSDEELYHRIYALKNPMNPGDSIPMEVDMTFGEKGFSNSGQGLGGAMGFNLVAYNGSFLNSSIFPSIGYSQDKELSSDIDREKQGLPEKPYRMPEIDDPYFKENILFTDDSDLIKSDILISTSADQIAVAPGYLQKEWKENGRKYFHYVGERKGHLFFSFVSARYEVMEETYMPAGQPGNEVTIQIYHHPTHTYNLEHFMQGTKDALDYYTENFSPFQHRQLRILEFPRYSGFAQSFDGTVPFSESFGWVNNYRDPEKANVTYWVTAHEVAHQWWGHQLYGRATRGSNIMSESLADYSAAMVLLHGKGKEQYRHLIKDDGSEAYLTGRSSENKVENVWLNSEGQQYLDYNKGLLAMNAFKGYLGEDKVNNALHQFMADYRFQENGPFISTENFYQHLKAMAPDSMMYLIEDYCKRIVLYENRLVDASFEKVDDGYEVTMKLNTKKVVADGSGKEQEEAMHDLVELGVFTEDAEGGWQPLKLEQRWLETGEQEVKLKVDTIPSRVVIDPYYLLADKNPEDNTRKL